MDWGFLIDRNGELLAQEILIDDLELTQWLVAALLKAQAIEKIALVDSLKTPELLGISFQNLRAAIREASFLRIERMLNTEMVLMVE